VIGILDGVKAQTGEVIFHWQNQSFAGRMAEIPSIEPGTMETGREMTIAAAWRAAARVALSAGVLAEGRIFLAGVRGVACCMVLTIYGLD